MRSLFRIALPLLCSYAAGLIASLFIGPGVTSWYAGLHKPPLSPALGLFPIAFIVLYALLGIAAAIIWLQETPLEHHGDWIRFFFIALLFNSGWILLFFAFQGLLLSFMDALVLFFFVVGLIATAYHIDRRAYYLLWPYFLFTLWIAYLSAGVWYLN